MMSEMVSPFNMSCALTIVIPTLNRLELAKRALASALAQTMTVESSSLKMDLPMEPTTISGIVLPANVRYFHRDTTIPVQDHGAFLREQVRTEWVVFLSDDDELEPAFAEETFRLIGERPMWPLSILPPTLFTTDSNVPGNLVRGLRRAPIFSSIS